MRSDLNAEERKEERGGVREQGTEFLKFHVNVYFLNHLPDGISTSSGGGAVHESADEVFQEMGKNPSLQFSIQLSNSYYECKQGLGWMIMRGMRGSLLTYDQGEKM